MRFFNFILKCSLALILAVGLYCIAGNAIAHTLFRSVFSGLGYDTALPLSIATAFALMLALVITVYFLWRRRKSCSK